MNQKQIDAISIAIGKQRLAGLFEEYVAQDYRAKKTRRSRIIIF